MVAGVSGTDRLPFEAGLRVQTIGIRDGTTFPGFNRRGDSSNLLCSVGLRTFSGSTIPTASLLQRDGGFNSFQPPGQATECSQCVDFWWLAIGK